jgi:hypothetical protein
MALWSNDNNRSSSAAGMSAIPKTAGNSNGRDRGCNNAAGLSNRPDATSESEVGSKPGRGLRMMARQCQERPNSVCSHCYRLW